MNAYVNQSGCIGCGLCASVCPNVFRLTADGVAEAYASPVPKEDEALARSAAEGCPAAVIEIKD